MIIKTNKELFNLPRPSVFLLKSASFSLPSKTLLHPISVQFDPGKVYGLIGHNGSGKSTLIKLLAKQQLPTAGHVLLNNKDITVWSNRSFAQEVAYLPQHLPAATGLTARELILMGRYAWHGLLGRYTQEDFEIVEQALALTHTERFADQLVDVLSGGERQRIWLAMCLAQQSKFLLLDEPLAALDIAHQVEVMQLVHHLARHLDITIIIVIHDINLAAQYCDELLALHQGRLMHQGSPDTVMNSAVLKDIYSVDMHIMSHPITNAPVALV